MCLLSCMSSETCYSCYTFDREVNFVCRDSYRVAGWPSRRAASSVKCLYTCQTLQISLTGRASMSAVRSMAFQRFTDLCSVGDCLTQKRQGFESSCRFRIICTRIPSFRFPCYKETKKERRATSAFPTSACIWRFRFSGHQDER